MSQTYDFGAGPVPAHQHANGGGWVADTATVAAHVYVGPRARVAGGTIRGGTIMGGTIEGGTVWGGTIEGGTVWGGTVWGGTIRGGTVWGGTIEGGTIRGGTIMGGTIEGGTVWGGTIEGGTIMGGTVWGGARITRTEDVLVIGPLGSRDDLLTIYAHEDGAPRVATGCFNGTPDEFLTAVQRTHGDTPRGQEYTTAVTFALGLWDARRSRV